MVKLEISIEKKKNGCLKITVDRLVREDWVKVELDFLLAIEKTIGKIMIGAAKRTKGLKVTKKYYEPINQIISAEEVKDDPKRAS
ncbi:MAG: hypothetical protein AB9897_01105 [Anaerolineaceae bacterium]